MDVTCFSSSHPGAANATVVYNDSNNHGNLWSRGDLMAPLPRCGSSPSSNSTCDICVDKLVDKLVHVVCLGLNNGTKVVMEGLGEHVEIVKSACPGPPSDGKTLWTDVQSRWVIAAGVIFIIIIIIIMVIRFLSFRRWRSKKVQNQLDQNQLVLVQLDVGASGGEPEQNPTDQLALNIDQNQDV